MFKKIIALALTLAVISCMAIVAVSAAEVSDSAVGAEVSGSAAGADSSNSASGASGDLIYFDANGWSNFSKIYCHIYKIGGDSFFGWQTGAEECKKVKGTKYSYDLSSLNDSTQSGMSGGMKSGTDYAVLFSANTGIQTYDTTIGPECKGDTAYIKSNQIENPVDSNKKGNECVWTNNSGKYGPHLALTSVGHIVGSKLGPNETGIQVIGDWVPDYFNSTYCTPKDVLAKAYPKFGIKTADDLTKAYGVCEAKVKKNSKYDTADLPEMKKLMEDAFYKAYPSQKGKDVIDEKAAEEVSKKIESGQSASSATGGGSSTGSASGGSSSAGATSTGGTYSSGDSSGSGADGQETTIFFVLGGIMAAAAGAMFISRKKRED